MSSIWDSHSPSTHRSGVFENSASFQLPTKPLSYGFSCRMAENLPRKCSYVVVFFVMSTLWNTVSPPTNHIAREAYMATAREPGYAFIASPQLPPCWSTAESFSCSKHTTMTHAHSTVQLDTKAKNDA